MFKSYPVTNWKISEAHMYALQENPPCQVEQTSQSAYDTGNCYEDNKQSARQYSMKSEISTRAKRYTNTSQELIALPLKAD